MPLRIATLGIFVLCASAAFGQSASGSASERTFRLVGGESPVAMQEMVNLVRAAADMRGIASDPAHASIMANGTPDQVDMAAWLIAELDQPTKAANLTYPAQGRDNVVRILYLAHTVNPQQNQQIVNSIRSVTEIQRIMIYNPSSAVVLRSSQAQAALAEWMIRGLDLAPGQAHAPAQTPVSFAPGQVAQILYLHHLQDPQQIQEMVNVIRALGDTQRLIAYGPIQAIALRGTAAQAALATWVAGELDQPARQAAAADSYSFTQAGGDGLVRIFYLPGPQTTAGLQDLISQIRAAGPLPRVIAYSAAQAVALRGTAGQVALAEQVIQQHSKL